MRDERSSNCET